MKLKDLTIQDEWPTEGFKSLKKVWQELEDGLLTPIEYLAFVYDIVVEKDF